MPRGTNLALDHDLDGPPGPRLGVLKGLDRLLEFVPKEIFS